MGGMEPQQSLEERVDAAVIHYLDREIGPEALCRQLAQMLVEPAAEEPMPFRLVISELELGALLGPLPVDR